MAADRLGASPAPAAAAVAARLAAGLVGDQAAAGRRRRRPEHVLQAPPAQPGHRAGAVRGRRASSTTARCARTRRSSTSRRCLGLLAVLSRLGTDDQRGALVDRARRRVPGPAERSSRRSRWSPGWRCCWPRRRTHGAADRAAVDVPLVARAGAVPLRAGHAAARPRHGAWCSSFTVFGVLLLAGAPARWLVGLRARRRAGRVRGGAAAACSRTTRSTGSRRSPTRTRTRAAPAYNTTQARIAIGNGGLSGTGPVPRHPDDRPVRARAADRLRVHGRGRGARAGRRRRRSSLLFGAAAVADAADRGHGRGPVRPAGRGRRRAAGSAFQAFENIGMTLGIMPDHRPAAAVRLLRRLGDVRQL